MIIAEVMTRKSCPIHHILSFLDALFRSSPIVVEMDDILLAQTKVGNKEPDSREKLATMPFHFCYYPALMTQRRSLVLELVVQDDWCLRRTPN